MNELTIPPALLALVRELRDKGGNLQYRENVANRLDDLSRALAAEVATFRKEKTFARANQGEKRKRA